MDARTEVIELLVNGAQALSAAWALAQTMPDGDEREQVENAVTGRILAAPMPATVAATVMLFAGGDIRLLAALSHVEGVAYAHRLNLDAANAEQIQ